LPPAARKLSRRPIRTKALAALTEAGHQVDSLDLYDEKFDPALSEEGYALYHLNVATEGQRAAFMDKVARAMRGL
jgi:putative NADPH-quinone reductase